MTIEVYFSTGKWRWRRIEDDATISARSQPDAGMFRRADAEHDALRDNPDATEDNLVVITEA